MSNREGNLEAPTRHPLDWKSADFHDAASPDHKFERVVDICHGCRRRVSLCGTFPTLFDLINSSPTFEVDGVHHRTTGKRSTNVIYATCATRPNVRTRRLTRGIWIFSHLMLRAKAVKFKNGEVGFRDRLLTNTDALGKLAGIAVVTQTVNAVNRTKAARSVMEDALGDRQESLATGIRN